MIKVFSGIRPSGKLHLGNYLGAIKNWIELQDKADQAIFAVVDYHGITTPYDPATYKGQVMDVILDYLAAGIDPDKSLLIRQSKVPQHTELAWIFNTITPVSWLDRLPNYREKIKQVEIFSSTEKSGPAALEMKDPAKAAKVAIDNHYAKSYQNNLSLLAYPVLMTADILIYKSNLVPIGEDQLVHLNLANEIGAKFNHIFGEMFQNIKAHTAQGARIMSLKNPLEKMSKMGDSRILLIDDEKTIRGKMGRATTDSEKEVKFDEKEKPGISNLLTIYSLLSKKEIKDIEKEYAGKNYGDFKNDLAEVVVDFLKPFQEKRKEFEKDPKLVMQILERSEEQARKLAQATLDEVKEKMGLM